jgi:hypothetical protein
VFPLAGCRTEMRVSRTMFRLDLCGGSEDYAYRNYEPQLPMLLACVTIHVPRPDPGNSTH